MTKRLLTALCLFVALVSVKADGVIWIEASAATDINLVNCVSSGLVNAATVSIDSTSLSAATDDLLVYITCFDDNASTFVAPTMGGSDNGWSTASNEDGGTPSGGPGLAVFYKEIASGDVDGTFVVDWTNANSGSGAICKITNHDATPFNTNATSNGDSTTVTSPSVAIGTNGLAVYVGCFDGGSDTLACPSGLSSPGNCNQLFNGGNNAADLTIAWENATTTAGPVDFTSDGAADEWRTSTTSFDDAP